jgi:hypothetical protein
MGQAPSDPFDARFCILGSDNKVITDGCGG